MYECKERFVLRIRYKIMTEIEEIHGILHKLSKEDFEKVRFYINKITLKAIEFEKSKVKENELLHNVSKRCVCGSEYNGIECNSCGFDASEVDIY